MSPAHAANSPTARIAITGTRTPGIVDEDLADRFDRYLAPFDGPASTWLLGGAGGIDTLALRWLTEHGEGDLVVAVPVAMADQPGEAGAAIRQAEAAVSHFRREERFREKLRPDFRSDAGAVVADRHFHVRPGIELPQVPLSIGAVQFDNLRGNRNSAL